MITWENDDFIDYHTTPRGMCWLVGGCNWWNPPDDWIGVPSITKPMNLCMKCWKMKKEVEEK